MDNNFYCLHCEKSVRINIFSPAAGAMVKMNLFLLIT